MKLRILLFLFLTNKFVQSVPLADQTLPSSTKVLNDSLVTSKKEILDKKFKTYRLPNNSIPHRYDLWLKTEVDKKNFNFSGRVEIHIKVLEPTQIITLHCRQIFITKIDLLDVSRAVISESLHFQYEPIIDFLEITLPTQGTMNEELVLVITYTGELRSDNLGFFRTTYSDFESDKDVWYATTQFQMTEARSAMPCYDEPAIRAVMGLEIQHTKNYHAISNMPALNRSDVDGTDYVTTKFQDTIPMQTYLLAFVISDFDYVSNNDVTTEQRIYADPEKIKRGDGDFALSVVGPVLRKMEKLFGVNYPLPKMDHVAIDYFYYGAMENIGLVNYNPTNLLYHQIEQDEDSKMNIIEVISHELAHQFFGNIVTPNWWSYTWLNEGFATLFQFYIPSLIYPEDQHMEQLQTFLDEAFEIDVVDYAAVPLNFYVETPEKIESKFNKISYRKGAAMLLMFMEAMTVPTFMKGLKFYLTDMYLKSATPDDLHRNLQKAYDEDFPGNNLNLGVMMSTWEDQAGYPMIHVTKTSGGFYLNQSRFGGGSEVYSIPISYTTKSELDFETKVAKLWMTTASTTIESNDDWVILNIQSTGYYKVSYSNEIWESFIETLNNNHTIIPIMPYKVQLFKDMLTALKEGSVNSSYGLSIIKYLKNENALQAWREVSGLDEFYKNSLFGTEFYDDYLVLLRSVTRPHLDQLGFTSIEGESSDDSEFRKLIISLSCSALDPSCLKFEEDQRVVANETGADLESFNFCASPRNAPADVYEFYLNAMLNETNKDIWEYVSSLGCTLNAELLEKFLQTSLDNTGLGEDNTQYIISYAMITSSVAFKTTLRFIKTNFINIHET